MTTTTTTIAHLLHPPPDFVMEESKIRRRFRVQLPLQFPLLNLCSRLNCVLFVS